jgi:hypothetical protein
LTNLKEIYAHLRTHHAKRLIAMKTCLRVAQDEDVRRQLPVCDHTARALLEISDAENLLLETVNRLTKFFQPSSTAISLVSENSKKIKTSVSESTH